MGKQQYLRESQETAFRALDEIWVKMKDEDPMAVKKVIDEAVNAVRET